MYRDNNKHDRLIKAKTVVIKLGTRLLTDSTGKINFDYMENLIRVLSEIKNEDRNIIIVSSGAIGAGIGRMDMPRRPVTIPEKQAAAAVGQGLLIQYYEKYFARYKHIVAQILLTREDLISRRRYINACNTILTLIKWGVVPVINENDSVSAEEIKFGDNDRLSALVSGLVNAELLLILTDIDGLYDANPVHSSDAKLLPLVEEITPAIKQSAGNTNDDLATGGMITKIQAAEIAVNSGVNMVIANGKDPSNLFRIFRGEKVGTLFTAKDHFLSRRKRWIAYGLNIMGEVIIDEGARNALLTNGKSLLAIGVTDVKGDFHTGDLVIVKDAGGNEIGRGLVNYSSEEIRRIMKLPSSKISEVLGYQCEKEVIHRDDMAIDVLQ